MKQLKLLLITVIALWSLCGFANAKVVNCYFGTWANYRAGDGKFDSSNIDPTLCTHLSYTFFGITAAGEFRLLDEWLDLDSGLGLISRTIGLKKVNPKLKVLAVVGGWNEGSENYSKMAADASKRKLFITSTLNFIRKHGFDGLDFDWEYPAQRGGSQQDKQNFVTLLKELRTEFEPYHLELSIAVGASENTARISYDIPNIAKYVDYINVMTYDFATADDRVLGFNAPLKGQGQNNVESSIKFWLQQGAPASKLVLGLAFYGRSFRLSNSQQTAAGSPSVGAGSAGPITQQAGFLGYNEICTLTSSWNYKWAQDYGVPFIYNSNEWIGYDNVQSIELKMDFLKSLNLAGAMVWSIETDDFRGKCGEKYPLLKAINKKLDNQINDKYDQETKPVPAPAPAPVPVPAPAPAPVPEEPSRPSVPENGNCSADGFFGIASDCTRFYRCVSGVRYEYQCSPSLVFDVASSACNWPNMSTCKN